MSSPIHKFLFSPPPSPPARAADFDPNHGLTSIKSLLLPTEFIPRSSLDGGASLKARSPRTPQQRFTLDNVVFPSPSRSKGYELDLEATPVAVVTLPDSEVTPAPRRRGSATEKLVASPVYQPANVPSAPLPFPSTLPKPVLRLLFLASLLFSSVLILVFVPAARLPSLRAASASRRLALSPDGHAYVDVANPVDSWSAAKDRDYRPPQIKASRMMRSLNKGERELSRNKVAQVYKEVPTAAHPKASRPALRPHPIPQTHELLALQSYILSSAYNVLPKDLDPTMPLDANAILGVGAHRLGGAGGEKEAAWLKDIEGEWDDEVIVWYGGNGLPALPHEVLDIIGATHNSNRHPTLIPCASRADRSVLLSIMDRLGLPLRDHPIIMIGNEPIVGDLRTLEEVRLSGELETKLSAIGWKKTEKKEGRKMKMAVVKKKELTEVEEATVAARK
ncbi:hypothetical protein IAT38_005070 [Cryptococcus sp. DSM 104549]